MRSKGFDYEKKAKCHLIKNGLTPVEDNFECKTGEIDLIMQHQSTLVFVEVRYRASARFGSALESIDYRKQKKLLATAKYYLQKYKRYNDACRFDTVTLEPNGHDLEINWTISAFGEEYQQ